MHYEAQAHEVVDATEDEYHRKVLNSYKIKNAEKAVLYVQSDERRKNDWSKLSPGGLMWINDTKWEQLARHEKRLEDQFYKAEAQLRTLAKGKERNPSANSPACGLASTPDEEQVPVSQNEPTEEESDTTQAPSEACNAPSGERPPESLEETSQKLPANPIQPIQLTKPPPE